MSRKRIIVDHNDWTIDEAAGQNVPELVKDAMDNSTVAEIAVLDDADRQVTLYLNGRTVSDVVIDLDLGPRPSEISG
jgi:hypothetical protein